MKNDEIRRAIEEIHNDLYYQKLGPIISELRVWLTEKDKLIDQFIIDFSQQVLESTTNMSEQVEKFCEQIFLLLSSIIDSLSKVGGQTLKSKRSNSTHSKKLNRQICFFKKSMQIWQARQQKLSKVSHSAQIIVSEIKKHSQENNRIFQQVKNHGKKIKLNSEWSDTEYMKMFTIASLKNNHKQYQINKIKQMAQMFNQQIKQYNTMYIKFCQLKLNLLNNQQMLLQALHSNIANFCALIGECFIGFDDNMIQQSQQFLKKMKKYVAESQNKQKQMEDQKIKGTEQLIKKLQSISQKALQQLLITSWNIKCKNPQTEKFIHKKGIITLDGKFYIVEENGKFMSAEINLAQAIINETGNLGEIVLKSKKKNRIYPKHLIKFEKVQNQDEFRLHLKRVQGLIQ